jgi:ABC-type multidrug transport system fused ATPase/permease subunit
MPDSRGRRHESGPGGTGEGGWISSQLGLWRRRWMNMPAKDNWWPYLAASATVRITAPGFATVLDMRLTGPLSSLATKHVNVTGSLAVFRRLLEYIDLPPQVADAPAARDLGDPRGAIRFEDITFTYPGATCPALDQISIDVAAGQLAALVGPSGAGKTTLTSLDPAWRG